MASDLRGLNQHLATQNNERRERIAGTLPPMRTVSDPPLPWRVRYRFAADRPGMTYPHSEATPRELVQWLRDRLKGMVIILKIEHVEEGPVAD